jgi:hypothetical protein
MNYRTLVCGFLVIATALLTSSAFAGEKKYRLTLIFTEPSFKWSRVIEYRDDFHLFLDAAPFPTVKGGIFVAGTVYPKAGFDYVSVTLGTSLDNKEYGRTLGIVKHLRLSKDGYFDIPAVGSTYKTCKARVEFLQ